MLNIEKTRAAIEAYKARSAWDKGKKNYMHELLDTLEYDPENVTPENIRKEMLNGADNWAQYSWGGASLIYDCDIAKALCSPSEFKRSNGGNRRPNSREEWLDTQARALAQAAWTLKRIAVWE